MRILVLSGMHPLPTNIARGTFVADHVRLLRDAGHDVRVVNPLPRMLRYQESRRSTLAGVAKAPTKHAFDGAEVLVPRYWGLSNQASSWLTASSVRRRASSVQRWLDGWTPETVVVHALWPVGHLALTLARTWNVPCIGVVHGWDLDVGLAHRDVGPRLRRMIADLDRLVLVAEEQRGHLTDVTALKPSDSMPRAGRGGLAPTHGLVARALATRPPRCPVPSRPSTAGKRALPRP